MISSTDTTGGGPVEKKFRIVRFDGHHKCPWSDPRVRRPSDNRKQKWVYHVAKGSLPPTDRKSIRWTGWNSFYRQTETDGNPTSTFRRPAYTWSVTCATTRMSSVCGQPPTDTIDRVIHYLNTPSENQTKKKKNKTKFDVGVVRIHRGW